jgi:hypothetical protein
VIAKILPRERCRKVNAMGDSKKTYRDLDAWKLAMTMVETTYAAIGYRTRSPLY